MMTLTQQQVEALRAALEMAVGGEVDPRVQVRGDAYTVDGGDSYTRDPRVAGVYAALAVLDALTPDEEADPVDYVYDMQTLEAMQVDDLRAMATRLGRTLPGGYVSKAALLDIILAGEED